MAAAVSPTKFAELAAAGKGKGQAVAIAARADASAQSGRRIRFILSDGSIDRAGDTIDPAGWRLDNYRRNPVVQWSHQTDTLPIGRMVDIKVEGGKLIGTAEFAEASVYEFADTVYRLLKEKYLNAGSVGFYPLKYAFTEDPGRRGGIDFLEQELLEFSICAVPCNSNALVQARAKGLIADRHLPRLIESKTPRMDKARSTLERIRREMAQ
jgi:HK97 family phage prohead protease